MKRIKGFRCLLPLLLFALLLSGTPVTADAAAKTYTYYGSHLSGENKSLYNRLKKTWAKGDTTAIAAYAYSQSVSAAGMWVLNDYPQYFWCNTYSSGFYGSYCAFRLITWKNAMKQKSGFTRRLNKVVSTLKKRSRGKSEAEKAVIIHDWICRNCSYVSSKYDQSAYGVLMKKKAVCSGYARCYKLLCDRLGLRSICVNVYLNSVPHLLNYVRIRGKWYLVDCTNDDQESFSRPLRDFCLAGSRSTGAYLTSSCGVYLPDLSEEDYPLSDRFHAMSAGARFTLGRLSVYDYDSFYDAA